MAKNSIFQKHLTKVLWERDFFGNLINLSCNYYWRLQAMLEFFRKYQRYFFIVISIVVIISFSFFGTYSTLSQDHLREQVAFKAIDGSEVKRSELDAMVYFISTDSQDKLIFGGVWGPNFLNDGVINKDFLETGLAQILASQYSDEVNQDLQNRLEKEKRFTSYRHPQASFLTADNVWNYLAPDIKTNLDVIRVSHKAVNPDVFEARTRLYLAEKKFPAPLLKQVLRYQEKQYSWLKPDEGLDHTDLSLFGYHTIEDWFGPRFVRIIAEFIINSAKIAEQKGYKVAKGEVIADLMKNANESFQQNANNPHLGVANPTEYYNEQLRRLGLDQTQAIKVWEQVMLFRRLFGDVGNANLIDPLAYQKFNAYAHDSVEGDLYHLPKDLQIKDFLALQKLEIYLNAVSKQSNSEKADLMPPTKFLSTAEVKKKNPELVQKRFILEMAHLKKDSLQSKVGIKETWNWEVEDENWNKLKKQFPDLGIKKGDTREERFVALDKLDEKTRSKVDAFARASIVNEHPEWVEKALEEAPTKTTEVGLRTTGGSFPIFVENREEFIQLLEQASLDEAAPNEASKKLQKFTSNNQDYYRIKVIDRSPDWEIMTFAEANNEASINPILIRELETYYKKIRETKTKDFQNEDGSWKPFNDVHNEVAELYFAKILKAIQNDYTAAIAPEAAPSIFLADFTSSLRFYAYGREVKNKIQKNPQAASEFLIEKKEEQPENKLAKNDKLEDQWKMIKEDFRADRSSESFNLDKNNVFALKAGEWSKVHTPPSGDINFFHLKKKGIPADVALNPKKLDQLHRLIADDAERDYMHNLVYQIKKSNAISLNYLNPTEESMEPETKEQ